MAHPSSDRAYTAVKRLLAECGGTMTWMPQPPGGSWIIALYGRSLPVRVMNRDVNVIDTTLYESPVPAPQTWDDYPLGEDTPLVRDAFWRLVALMQRLGT